MDRVLAEQYCLLDGILAEGSRTFHLLDVMAWKGQAFFDTDTAFRAFWLSSQLAERPELAEAEGPGSYAFTSVPFHPAKELEDLLAQPWPHKERMDGLLFYPSDQPYAAGSNPLIGWLKPFMVPQVGSFRLPL